MEAPQIDRQTYRIHWVTVCALLRAVGHVLDKVDSAARPELARVVNDKWLEWKADREQHAIFWEFIEAERNVLLKSYEARYFDRNVTIAHIPGEDGEPISFEIKEDLFSIFTPITSGRYSGEDARDIAKEAVAWWQEQLDDLERLVVAH
jgi:hypothetical protein